MAFTKKLQKVGGNSFGLLTSREMLGLLGVDAEADEMLVSLTIYGDALVIRPEGAKPLTIQQVGQLFGLEPEDAATLPKHLNLENIPADLKDTVQLLSQAPRTAYELSQELNTSKEAAEKKLNRAVYYRYAHKEGSRYSFNADHFDI